MPDVAKCIAGVPGPRQDEMSYEVYVFADTLAKALDQPMDIKADFDKIVICGMGGSAIGGDIIRDCIIGSVKCPVFVQRFPDLPKWVDDRTLVIISSYSGNTGETISMYNQATERGCRIVIMTSGGMLMENGIRNGDYIVKLSPGFQPRCALGSMLGHLANIVDRLCGTDSVGEIRRFLPRMFELRDALSSPGGEAERIAHAIGDYAPVIYATPGIYASAIRWRSQINENSKMLTFTGSVMEFSHSEVSGWLAGNSMKKCLPVFLYEVGASEDTVKLADASIAALKDSGQDLLVVPIEGCTPLERTLTAVMIGDYVSLYLAYQHGVDPFTIEAINKFKSRLVNYSK